MGKVLGVLRMILSSLALVVLMILMVPLHFIFNLSPETRFRIRAGFCQLCFWIMGIQIRMEGIPVVGKGPSIIVCNHRSLLDPFVCARFTHGCFLSKAEIAKYPVFGYGARITGTIFVQRDDKNSRKASRRAMEEALEEGKSIILFPEGTTSGEETTKMFYRGSFEIASDLKIPIIPMVLEYKNKDHYWTDGGLFEKSVEQMSKWKMHIGVWIGDPIMPTSAEQMLEKAQYQIDEKILEMHNDWAEESLGSKVTQF